MPDPRANPAAATAAGGSSDVALARVDGAARPSDALLQLARDLARGAVPDHAGLRAAFSAASVQRAQKLVARLAGAPPASALADADTLCPAALARGVLATEFVAYFRTAAAEPGATLGVVLHSLCAAAAAGRLAEHNPDAGVACETAFTAGLLHDLGRAVLALVFPRAYTRLLAELPHGRRSILDAERDSFGVDHPAVGRHVAGRWGLPENLCDAIWLHHGATHVVPRSVASPSLLALVQVADGIAATLVDTHEEEGEDPGRSLARFARSGWSEATLHDIRNAVAEEIEIYAAVLDLQEALEATLGASDEQNDAPGAAPSPAASLPDASSICAVTKFVARLREDCSPLDVIASMVAAVADCGIAGAAAAFSLGSNGRTADVVTPDGAGRVVELSDELRAAIRELARSPAPALTRAIRHGLFADRPLDPDLSWDTIPLVHAGELLGAVFIGRAADSPPFELSAAPRSFAALALAQARARSRLHALSNDLADANRRLQQAQARVLRSRTLSMIAEMAAGAGHELNSPLFVISGRAELLLSRITDPGARDALSLIHEKALECSRIVTELMEFARPPAPSCEPLDISALLRSVRADALAEGLLPAERLELLDRCGAGRSPAGGAAPAATTLYGDESQLRRVLLELLKNAADAVAENHGRITIELREARPRDGGDGRSARERERPWPPAADKPLEAGAAARWFEIAMTDTGIGMSPAVSERAFDPFFSHRRAGRRRGLGLTRAFRVIEAHGGRLWLDSLPHHGTTVHVLLPARGDAVPAD